MQLKSREDAVNQDTDDVMDHDHLRGSPAEEQQQINSLKAELGGSEEGSRPWLFPNRQLSETAEQGEEGAYQLLRNFERSVTFKSWRLETKQQRWMPARGVPNILDRDRRPSITLDLNDGSIKKHISSSQDPGEFRISSSQLMTRPRWASVAVI